ncbi:MAG: DUF4340 domain-containing protein [Anaerolineae bacterium]
MKRHNQILAGILVIQIILSVVVFWPKSSAAVESALAFPDLKSDDIVALTITDRDGNSTTLRQVTGSWVLPDADDYPAQADKITPLLDKVVGLTTDRLVTRTDTSHRRLQVAADNFVRCVDFETADGKKHTFYLGSSPHYGATHFRVGGQDETYLTDGITAWDTNATASSWVDTAYLRVTQDDVTEMTLENGNGTFAFTKDEDGNWTMDGLAADETLNEEAVTTLLQRATTVNLVTPLGKEEEAGYGMDAPSAVVTLKTGDKTITLRVGARDPDSNDYVVISSESPYYVRVSEFGVKHMVENARDDFIQAPPTPTPEG